MTFSKMMLGTVQFGLNYGIANVSGKPSYGTVCDILKTAYDCGVNCLDTSPAYGDSEEVLGRALKELGLVGKMHVITKVENMNSLTLTDSEAEKRITESVENSLRRLRMESLAACLMHFEDDIIYTGILQRLKQRGLICGAGVSLETDRQFNAVNASCITHLQLPYNVFDKRFDTLLPEVRKKGIKVFTRSAYLQGLLLMPEENILPKLNEVIPVRRRLEKLAAAAGITMAELCIRFVLSNPAVTSILTGVDNVKQLRENTQLLSKGPLPEDLHKEVNVAVPLLPETIIRPFFWKKEAYNDESKKK
jgi:aryl-alcohol dehydrogenase-like predicted oxidoreductase